MGAARVGLILGTALLLIALARVSTRPKGPSAAAKAAAAEHFNSGVQLSRNLTRESSEQAIAEFNRAIELFPAFKAAHLSLALVYRQIADRFLLPKDALSRARFAVDSALAIDKDYADARRESAILKMQSEWDWQGAESEFRRLLVNDPESVELRIWLARLLQHQGRLEESRAECSAALRANPLPTECMMLAIQQNLLENRFDDALGQLTSVANTQSPEIFLRVSLHTQMGNFDAAMQALAELTASENDPEFLAWMGVCLARLGRTAEAEEKLRKIKELSRAIYVSPRFPALVCVALGRKREALMHLGNAYTYRSPFMTGLKVEFPWNELRDEPRFKELVRRVGLE